MGNVFAILGGQWGDEGKGKFVDWAAKYFEISARATGGNNAGHTVYVGSEKHIFHLIPSAITWKNVDCLLGNGMVIDPLVLLKEIDTLEQRGYTVDNLYISGRAHVIFLHHKMLDHYKERRLGKKKLGTTGRGISPTYADKCYYSGIRINDLFDKKVLSEKISNHIWDKFGTFKHLHKDDEETIISILLNTIPKDEFFNEYRRKILALEKKVDFKQLTEVFTEMYLSVGKKLKFRIVDTTKRLEIAYLQGQNILLEGAQGLILDVDHGNYPHTTSSNSSYGGLITGLGIHNIDNVYSILKAYTSRVGGGPFPTELFDEIGNYLCDKGNEYGSTTGRPRRCGWHDAVLTRHCSTINGKKVIISKLDILSGLNELKICNSYKYTGTKRIFNGEVYFPGKIIKDFPADSPLFEYCFPYEWVKMPGWNEDISNCKTFEELPLAAQNYLKKIEELGNVEISLIGVGPEREQTIVMPGRWNLEVKQEKFVERPETIVVEELETNEIKAIIYDMDNTLVDTDGFVLEHLKRTAIRMSEEISFIIPHDEVIKKVQKMNLPFEEIFSTLFPNPPNYNFSEPLWEILLANYRKDAKGVLYSPTYFGTEVVNQMTSLGIVQGIVTNRVNMARHRLDQAGYNEFEFIVQPEEKEHRKPNPLCLKPALDNLQDKGISFNEVFSVGDHPDDYLAARDAGIKFIAVLTGESTKDDFVSLGLDENKVINNLGELKEKINLSNNEVSENGN
jgi:adenylosuccinate synthase